MPGSDWAAATLNLQGLLYTDTSRHEAHAMHMQCLHNPLTPPPPPHTPANTPPPGRHVLLLHRLSLHRLVLLRHPCHRP